MWIFIGIAWPQNCYFHCCWALHYVHIFSHECSYIIELNSNIWQVRREFRINFAYIEMQIILLISYISRICILYIYIYIHPSIYILRFCHRFLCCALRCTHWRILYIFIYNIYFFFSFSFRASSFFVILECKNSLFTSSLHFSLETHTFHYVLIVYVRANAGLLTWLCHHSSPMHRSGHISVFTYSHFSRCSCAASNRICQ